LTLRQAAELARISNPYLSQIEHGLSLPSITVMSSLADALSISVETLLLQAAGVAPQTANDAGVQTEDAIRTDPRLGIAQKQALLTVLASFVEREPVAAAEPGREPPAPKPAARTPSERRTTRRRTTSHPGTSHATTSPKQPSPPPDERPPTP